MYEQALKMLAAERKAQADAGRREYVALARSTRRDAVEENTGEKFSFNEKLHAYSDFVSDLQPADVSLHTRGLADVCLALLNSNEFVYVY